ncbi:MAG TPA: plastocyanin/azurin family copper-binding protein, partial [Chloroflexota bacterium]
AVWVFSLRGPANHATIAQPTAPKPAWTVVTISGPIVHSNTVTMIDYGFVAKGNPSFKNEVNLTSNRTSVPVGTKVTWVNTGALPHTSTSSTGHWDTGLVQPGGSASIVMNKVGTFTYSCTPHPWMIGQVIVTAK